LWCVVAENARAEEVRPQEPVECRWAEGEIAIDGKADESAWMHAQVVDDFSLPWLKENARPAKTKTGARLLWDRENLYFFADMEDSDLYADVVEHDGETWHNDVFELFIKPADDKPGYYEFQVNVAGAVMDMFLPRRGSGGYRRFKSDGEFRVEAAVHQNGTLNKWSDKDTGWSVEGRIPWQDFLRTGGRPTVGETWRFALCRYDHSVDFEGPELSTNAPLGSLPYPDFHRHEDYASLRFVGPDEKHGARAFGIPSYTPVTTSRVVGSPEPPLPYRAVRVLPKLVVPWPVYVVPEPGSRRLWIISQDQSYTPTRIVRTSDRPASGEIETLLEVAGDEIAYDIAFHPEFDRNRYLFVGSNGTFGGDEKKTRVTRYALEREPPFRLVPGSATTIIEWPSDGHNGGAMTFGRDGMLYVTSGDGTTDSDTNLRGQDLTHLTAKVLRIDVDQPAERKAYSVPTDNPFLGVENARPETWAYGLRNPWRITTDSKTGQIWVGNNGQDLWEQAYLIERGANYGWSAYEGSYPFYANRELGPTPVSFPTVEHPHSEARSLTGGVVYHGEKLPELRGAYIYGDYSTGKIWGVKHDGERVVWRKELADTPLQITALSTDVDGQFLIADHQGNDRGGFYTLQPNADDGSHESFPRRLSETGLFLSVRDHRLHPGAVPYSVNSPLWSDGAYKERYIVLPPTMKLGDEEIPASIDFTTDRGWNFPERTVLVKSFAMETREGDPTSRKWVETRLFTKQQGEWIGYSYRWNEEQTDAALVAKEGRDESFTIDAASDSRTQRWRYPSRAECMVCHTRAANFVLGPSLLQMNKDHDYDGVVDNQLRVLEHLGLLRVDWEAEAVAGLRSELRRKEVSGEEVDRRVGEATATRNQRKPRTSSLLFQPPKNYDRLANPYDASAPVNLRARSYLHANCAQCHVGAGGGNSQMDLGFKTAQKDMKTVGIKPLHQTFGIDDARLIAPGDPERSVLLHRVAIRGRGQMPPLATVCVDEEAVDLLSEWIRQLDRAEDPRPSAD
jgi:glucose/arabinose dehydrogenase